MELELNWDEELHAVSQRQPVTLLEQFSTQILSIRKSQKLLIRNANFLPAGGYALHKAKMLCWDQVYQFFFHKESWEGLAEALEWREAFPWMFYKSWILNQVQVAFV